MYYAADYTRGRVSIRVPMTIVAGGETYEDELRPGFCWVASHHDADLREWVDVMNPAA